MKKLLLSLLFSISAFGYLSPTGGAGGGGIPFVTPVNGQCLVGNALGAWVSGSCSTGSGTVTSVALSLPSSILTVSGSPVTGSGTLTATLANALNAASGLVQLTAGGALPAVSAANLTSFPTLNQNTTGTAANVTASSNSSLTTLSALSLPGSQVTGNIAGNAANVSATTNATLVTLSSLSLPGSQVTGNIAGNAANISASSNATLTTLSSLSLPASQISGTVSGTWTVGGTTTTTNSSATTIATVALTASSSYTCKAIISGFRTDSADYAHFELNGSVHSNGASTCTFEDSTMIYQKASDVGFTAAWACSGTNIVLQVVGNTGKTIDWAPKYICESVS